MTFTIIAMLLVALPVGILGACSYSKFGAEHTMCKYSAKPCAAGDKFCKRGIKASDKATILKTHNNLRSKVAKGGESGQPKASNMREMKYDNELATIAQRWADQLTFGHDENRKTAKYKDVGQNVGTSSSSAPTGGATDFQKTINSWYKEVKDFKTSQINPFKFTSATGHYSQVCWAKTDRVGCGFSYYKKNTGGQTWYSNLYVCNYGVGGNIATKSMYKQGAPATACSKGKSTSYPSLCAS